MPEPKLVHAQTWAGLSLSECESAGSLGIDEEGFEILTYRFSEFLLNRGFRLLFGHDWREDGVMRVVASLVESRTARYHEGLHLDLPRMLNLVPTQPSAISRRATQAAEESHGLLEIESLFAFCEDGPPPRLSRPLVQSTGALSALSVEAVDNSDILRNWLLRHLLTEIGRSGVRVCVGGRTTEYSGMYAGIAEEAFFACKADQPLYLIAGFGGSTAAVAACLSRKPKTIYVGADQGSPLRNQRPTLDQTTASFGATVEMPNNGLDGWFSDRYSLSRLSENNGLTEQENEALFRATDLEVIFHLFERGIQKLIDQGRLTAAASHEH